MPSEENNCSSNVYRFAVEKLAEFKFKLLLVIKKVGECFYKLNMQ